MTADAEDTAQQLYVEADALWDAGDLGAAAVLLRRGAALGDADCQNLLGVAYGDGLGVRRDLRRSLYWHKRAWAARGGRSFCSNVAVAYARGGHRTQAARWWRQAASGRDGDAALGYAKYLLEARRLQDLKRAIKLLKMAFSCRPWAEITPAGREEAQELLQQLRKSRRAFR